MGWFPDFPDADNCLAPFLDESNFLGSPYTNTNIRNTLIPQSRRAADRSDALVYPTQIQNIDADDVPILPLWQGNQYIAARNDVTGIAYAINSSSALQLWELRLGIEE
jgi:peptide/nickel transport system substrate-binding protein